MALGYRAVTSIKYGAPDGAVKEFAAGEPVSGLSNKAMKELWDAGALEQYEASTEEVTETEAGASDETGTSTEARDTIRDVTEEQ
jgi:hypothetical protein